MVWRQGGIPGQSLHLQSLGNRYISLTYTLSKVLCFRVLRLEEKLEIWDRHYPYKHLESTLNALRTRRQLFPSVNLYKNMYCNNI